MLQYTGGTTGQPKGAMLTHANFCAVINIFNHWSDEAETRSGQALCVLPLFHIFGLTFIVLLTVANGAQAVLLSGSTWTGARRHRPQEDHRIPRRADHVHRARQPSEGEGVRPLLVAMWSSGGAPLPMEVLQRFEGLTGHAPRGGYGLTETAPLGTLQPDGPARQGSVGLPVPARWKWSSRDRHRCCRVGERGEICFRGPQT